MAPHTALVAALVVLAAADDTSLIQRQLDVKSVAERSQGSCECLNWKSTYQSGKVKCGNANEFFFQFKDSVLNEDSKKQNDEMEHLLWEINCKHFYELIDDNACVNIDRGPPRSSWNSKQWCYVSSECDNLKGGKVVKDGNSTSDSMRTVLEKLPPAVDRTQAEHGLAWKVCTGPKHAGTDRLLRDMDMPELAAYSKKHQLDLKTLVVSAYFVKRDLLGGIKFMGNKSDSQVFMASPAIQQKDVPIVYEITEDPSGTGLLDSLAHVVQGGQNWLIDTKPEFRNHSRHVEDWSEFQSLTKLS